jgi:hypothetical protein
VRSGLTWIQPGGIPPGRLEGTATATQRTPSSFSCLSIAKPRSVMTASSDSSASRSVWVDGVAGGHPGASEQCPHMVMGEHGLPDARAVRRDPAADLGEHAHRLGRWHVSHVHDLLAAEPGEIGGLAQLAHQFGQQWQGPCGNAGGCLLAQPDQP